MTVGRKDVLRRFPAAALGHRDRAHALIQQARRKSMAARVGRQPAYSGPLDCTLPLISRRATISVSEDAPLTLSGDVGERQYQLLRHVRLEIILALFGGADEHLGPAEINIIPVNRHGL